MHDLPLPNRLWGAARRVLPMPMSFLILAGGAFTINAADAAQFAAGAGLLLSGAALGWLIHAKWDSWAAPAAQAAAAPEPVKLAA